jgi:hypothetical protein
MGRLHPGKIAITPARKVIEHPEAPCQTDIISISGLQIIAYS